MSSLEKYLKEFVSLNVASSNGKKAPHKAILLLAIIDSIADGLFQDNHIVLTEDLVSRFNDIWEEYSSPRDLFQPKSATPFWHLKNEPFYHLFFNDGSPATELVNPYSVTKLRKLVYASLDGDLFEILKKDNCREELQAVLIINYLDDSEPDVGFDTNRQRDRWIIASNATYFHIDDCIREVGHVFWRQHVNASVGDYVYLYGTRPECRIKYLMEVKAVDLPFSENMNDEKYWDSSETYEVRKKYSRFMKLELVKRINNPKLTLSELLRHGLKAAPQSPVRISQPAYEGLLRYIQTNE